MLLKAELFSCGFDVASNIRKKSPRMHVLHVSRELQGTVYQAYFGAAGKTQPPRIWGTHTSQTPVRMIPAGLENITAPSA
jgi:hypothetical protein